MLSAGELISLIEHAGNPIERIALSLGMNTGLRGNDIKQLTVFDASLSQGMIQTEIRKTKKIDSKPITMDLARELTLWLHTYADLIGVDELPNDALLMPSYQVDPQGKIHLRPYRQHTHPWRLVQRPLERMGYPTKGEGLHTLRRSSARAFFESLREGGEARDHALMIVQDFLNHSSTQQTQRYLGLNQERTIRDALLKDKPFLSSLAQAEQARVNPDTVIQLGA
jgi:integrase